MHVYGQDVKAVDGTTAPIRNVLPVPLVGSKDKLQPGRPSRDEGAKAALRPFADALKGFLGPTGKLSLQGAGTKLRQVPNFAEAMVDQKNNWKRLVSEVPSASPRVCCRRPGPKKHRETCLGKLQS